MKKIAYLGIVLILSLVLPMAVFARGADEEVHAGDSLEGQKITALYFSATYAEAAKEYAPEFKELTGIEVEVVD